MSTIPDPFVASAPRRVVYDSPIIRRPRHLALVILLLVQPLAGCATGREAPDTARPFVEVLLRRAYETGRESTLEALNRTAQWLDDTGGDHDAREIVDSMRVIVRDSADPATFARRVESTFTVQPYAGTDSDDAMHFTAYYAPQYAARRLRSDRFRYPLHRRPGSPALRGAARRSIVEDNLLEDLELVWLDDALNAYLVQVNGSARLLLEDGQVMCVGHAATNERAYTSLGRLLIDAGRVPEASMSMAAIRDLHQRDPDVVESLFLENERYVFFESIPCDQWPRASTGMTLTPNASIAADPAVLAPGTIVLVETTLPDGSPYVRLMVSQDTGGAIRGGRIDLYLGVGEDVGDLAGRINAPGRVSIFRK